MSNHTKKMMIAVFGRDRPGIVARVSGLLAEMGCNIEDATQTILHDRFAGMFVVQPVQESLAREQVLRALEDGFQGEELTFWLSPMEEAAPPKPAQGATDPFVLTTIGPDQLGLVAGVTGVLSRFGVNITAAPCGCCTARVRGCAAVRQTCCGARQWHAAPDACAPRWEHDSQ